MRPLPDWMRPSAATDDLPQARRRSSAVRRALGGFASLIAGALNAESGLVGLLQIIDPRAKVVGLIGLVVISTLVHTFPALLIAYTGALALAAASRIPAGKLARAWLVAPLFSAAIALPAVFNVVTEGRHVWTVWRFTSDFFGPWALPDVLAVTDSGLVVAGRFVLRAAVCVSFAMLLALTTRPDRLFRGLRALGVPRIFVMLLAMMERYLVVLARTAEEIHLAKISRSVAVTSTRREQAWTAAGMGSLFRRTISLGSAVHLAMVSRGWTGDAKLLDEPKMRARDWAFLAACAAFGAVVMAIG